VRRRLHIRTKLAAALAIPVLTLVGVAGYEVARAHTNAQQANDQADIALAISGPGTLMNSLQNERNAVGLHILGLPADLASVDFETYEDALADTDAGLVVFEEFLDTQPAHVQAIYEPAMDALYGRGDRADDSLDQLRDDGIHNFEGEPAMSQAPVAEGIFNRYSDLIDRFHDANSRLAGAIDNTELRRGAALVDTAARQADAYARITGIVVFSVMREDEDGQPDLRSQIPDTDIDRISDLADLRRQIGTNNRQLEVNAAGAVTSLWIVYEQHCEGGRPALIGEVRYAVPGSGGRVR
jgi:hypothetical protein